MLGFWRSHADYQQFVTHELSLLAQVNPCLLFEYESAISKAFILNLDPLKEILQPLYSATGRPSQFQPEIFRAFLLMNHLDLTLDQWLFKVSNNYLLQIGRASCWERV